MKEEEKREIHVDWLNLPHTQLMLSRLLKAQLAKKDRLVAATVDGRTQEHVYALGGRVAGIGDALQLLTHGAVE